MKNKIKITFSLINKGFFIAIAIFFSAITGFSQSVSINNTGAAPNASAGLDISFANYGFLIPRVALSISTGSAPLIAHVAGMLVYNTTTSENITPGLFYDDGTKWVAASPQEGVNIGDMQFWNGTAWAIIPVGNPGQKLQISSTGAPAWNSGVLSAINTIATSLITSTTAQSGGNITSDGGTAVISRGVCWSPIPLPTIANSKTTDGSGSGLYNSNLTGLNPGTIYYIRAYATNSAGTSYGNQVSFTTP